MEVISREIDFEYYTKVGIIDAHFPMHNRNTVQDILESMAKYKYRLLKSFIGDNYMKYLQPLNLIKNYYGEKFAWEYIYLIHYQAWL